MQDDFDRLDRTREDSLQARLRQSLVAAIDAGRLRPGQRLPPSRRMAEQLGVARNTVTAVYDELAARGYLRTAPRQGCFVAEGADAPPPGAAPEGSTDWTRRLRLRPSLLPHIVKPSDWRAFAYPFVYGQVDPRLFPLDLWRACSRDSLGRAELDWWAADRAVDDDPMLVEQIRARILPRRGVYARPDEILITLGSQEGHALLSRLLGGPGRRAGVEDPGYPDARFVFCCDGAELVALPVDAEGANLDPAARADAGRLDLAILTPGAHCPSMVAMSPARRAAALALGARDDMILIEDDYEGETAPEGAPALKAADAQGRVAHLGTLSKVLAPGVRLGYMVAPAPLIAEARWLRRLLHRSAPLNNQRLAAIFLAEGHYLALARRLREAHARRWARAAELLPRLLPEFRPPEPFRPGAAIWLECPPEIDGRALARRAAARSVLIESGDPFVAPSEAGRWVRLGLSCIDETAIAPGLRALAEAAEEAAAEGRARAPAAGP